MIRYDSLPHERLPTLAPSDGVIFETALTAKLDRVYRPTLIETTLAAGMTMGSSTSGTTKRLHDNSSARAGQASMGLPSTGSTYAMQGVKWTPSGYCHGVASIRTAWAISG